MFIAFRKFVSINKACFITMKKSLLLILPIILIVGISCSHSSKRAKEKKSYPIVKIDTSKKPIGKGVDLSHHNPEPNWKQLDVDFIFLKATEGSDYTDPTFKKRRKKCRDHNIPIGAYHFFTGRADAKKEFNHFKNTVGKDIDLIPVIDAEIIKGVSPEKYARNFAKFVDLIYDHYGRYPIIYSSEAFFNKHLYGAIAEKMSVNPIHLWYGDIGPKYHKFRIKPSIHQRSIKVVPGTSTKVDYNELYVDLEVLKL